MHVRVRREMTDAEKLFLGHVSTEGQSKLLHCYFFRLSLTTAVLLNEGGDGNVSVATTVLGTVASERDFGDG